jgi:hypothetical protein
MIHIYVDYQGQRAEETNSFMDTGDAYLAKLDEIEAYTGKIDQIIIFIGNDKAGPTWDKHPREDLVKTTDPGIAARKGRQIKYP